MRYFFSEVRWYSFRVPNRVDLSWLFLRGLVAVHCHFVRIVPPSPETGQGAQEPVGANFCSESSLVIGSGCVGQ